MLLNLVTPFIFMVRSFSKSFKILASRVANDWSPIHLKISVNGLLTFHNRCVFSCFPINVHFILAVLFDNNIQRDLNFDNNIQRDLNFQVITLNVRGLREYKKRRNIFHWLKTNTSPNSIVFLQETHSDKSTEHIWMSQWRGDITFSYGTQNARGTLIGFREGLDYIVKREFKDNSGRYVILDCLIQDHPFLLINLYNANLEDEQVKVLNDLNRLIDDIDDHHEYEIIFGGDFDFIRDAELDSDRGNPTLKYSSIAALQSLADSRNMIDIWRCRNPNSKRFTFRQPTPLIQRRLDYSFISNTM